MNDISNTTTDPMAELEAMTEIAKALQGLDSDAIKRVLIWAADRFNTSITLSSTAIEPDTNINNETESTVELNNSEEFSDVADLYSATSPRNDSEKALLVAYWFQKLKAQADFDSATINKELKHLGHGVSNITAALNSLISRKPQLVIQTRKSGKSQQSRKRYKLTNEGIKQIERMIKGEE